MDPQKLLLVDKRIIIVIRSIGVLLSLTLAVICLLIRNHTLSSQFSYAAASLPISLSFIVVGLLQAVWNPYTYRKVTFFSIVYILLGAALSVLVIGFSGFIFWCWLALLIVVGIYFGYAKAMLGYSIMILSLLIWIVAHSELQTTQTITDLGLNALAVGFIISIVASIWRVAVRSVKDLENAQTQKDFEHGQLSSLINSMGDGVIAVDDQVKVLMYNAAALNVLDINSSMHGQPLTHFLRPLTKDNATIDITNFVQNTKTATTNRDLRIKYGDGSFANLYLSVAPVHLGYGKQGTQGFVLMLRDITREKSLEEERDEFISVVSHELRTPVAISEGNISNAQFLAAHKPDPEQMSKALDEAHSQILFLSDMINDLSTLSRAERGKLTLKLEDIDLTAFSRELADNYQDNAAKKNLEFKLEIDPNATKLHSSKLYVREILQNFITNAIKYTESGSVTLTATPQEKGVLFTVSDTGIGISKGDQERVFDKFFRSEDFRTRQNKGTGLGLYVTTKLARIIHAEITLSSELNKGSTFSIFIPDLKK